MKGICYIEPLFHKVVKREKTQTRRMITIQPLDDRNWRVGTLADSTAREDKKKIGKNHYLLLENEYTIKESDSRYFTPKYKVGEIVYLKEPFVCYQETHQELMTNASGLEIAYKYGNNLSIENITGNSELKWGNKLFMPERYARYFIRITAVRAERLQDITNVDCRKEGVDICKGCIERGCSMGEVCAYPSAEYKGLINKIHGKGTWEKNPFVWVYDFELINK